MNASICHVLAVPPHLLYFMKPHESFNFLGSCELRHSGSQTRSEVCVCVWEGSTNAVSARCIGLHTCYPCVFQKLPPELDLQELEDHRDTLKKQQAAVSSLSLLHRSSLINTLPHLDLTQGQCAESCQVVLKYKYVHMLVLDHSLDYVWLKETPVWMINPS